jgi:hypothetical protein
MVKIIGNGITTFLRAHGVTYLLLAVMVCSTICFAGQPRIEMSLRTSDGEETDKAALGQPLTFEITLADIESTVPQITIEGLEQGGGHRVGYYSLYVNNNATYKYTYQLIYTKPGMYQLKPVIVIGDDIYDQQFSIEIVDKTTPLVGTKNKIGSTNAGKIKKITQKKKDCLESVQLLFAADKTEVVVGEKMSCTISLLHPYDYNDLSERNWGQEGTMPFTVLNSKGPSKSTIQHDGREYKCIQWTFDLYPEKAGDYLVPAFFADVVQPDTRHSMSMLSLFLGTPERKKRIYSNALKVVVKGLPAGVAPDIIVGSFASFTLTCSPKIIDEGSAATAYLELKGDANFDNIVIEELSGIPDGLRCYSSKQQVHAPSKYEKHKSKKFEFILQGISAGKWHIPAQELIYFDVVSRTVQTIATQPLDIVVRPTVGGAKVPKYEPQRSADTKKNSISNELVTNTNKISRGYRTWQIEWSLFMMLLLLPLLIPLYLVTRYLLATLTPWWRHRIALLKAQLSLKRASEQKNGAALYQLMVTFIVDQTGVKKTAVTAAMIEDRLRNVPVSELKIEEWNVFWARVNAYPFGEHGSIVTADEKLFDEAGQWLTFLRLVL